MELPHKGHSPPHFSADVCCGQTVASPSYCWALVTCASVSHFMLCDVLCVHFSAYSTYLATVYVTICRAVLGMLTVGNMMSMVTKGKVDVTDTVSKVVYRQFKQVWDNGLFLIASWETANSWNEKESLWECHVMVALWNRACHYIFAMWFLSSFFFFFCLFFPCLISPVRYWMSTIHRHGVPLVRI